MSRAPLRRRAGHEKREARGPARRKLRSAGGRHAAAHPQGDAVGHDDETLDAQYGENAEQLDARHDERLDARLDDRLDERLDQRLDQPLDASAWPRYLPEANAKARPAPDVETVRPDPAGEEARAEEKRVKEAPPADTPPLPAAPDLPVPVSLTAPLTPPLAPLPQLVPLVPQAPASLDKAETKAEKADTKDGGGKDQGGKGGDAKGKAGAKGDPKKDGKKDAKKDGKKAAGKGAAAGGGKPAGTLVGVVVAAEEVIEPDPLPPDEPTTLDVAREVDAPSVQAEWSAPAALPDNLIPATPRRTPAAEQAAKNGKPEEKQKAAAEATAHQAARDKALRAYSELVQTARGKQQAFLTEVSTVSNYMAHAYGMTANDITQTHDAGIQAIDAEAERQCAAIESNALTAELDLQTAHDSALKNLRAAAGSAFGTINANDKAAAALISGNVGGLKTSHQGRFDGEKTAYEDAVKGAVKALQKWSDERTTIYPINTTPLKGAQHEKYHPRVETMAKAKIKELEDTGKETIKAWTSTSDNSLCTVTCSYQFEQDQARTTTFEGGRKAVSKALNSAKKGLAEQLEQGRLNIRRMRQAALVQVRTQQRNSRSTLTSQARATLNGARRGAQGAIGSVQSAARGALPGYWRSLGGFEQGMRMAVPGGAVAIDKAAQTGAAPILRGLENTTVTLRDRLDENKQRLDGDQAGQKETLGTQRDQHIAMANEAMAKAPEGLAEQASAALTSFNDNATQLADSVSDAAQSCAKEPAKLFEKSFGEAKGRAQGSLDAIFKSGGGGKKEGDNSGDKGKGKGEGEGPKPDCSGCNKPGEGGGKGDGKGGGESKGITEQREDTEKKLKQYDDPANNPEFSGPLKKAGSEVAGKVKEADINATKALDSGFIDKVDEGAVTAPLRGLTAARGRAVDQRDYPDAAKGPSLSADMRKAMGKNDKSYKAAVLYLQGKTKEGAKAELDASQNWYNDQEDRIEATMRALSPEDAAAIGADPALYERIHGALDGTDAKVFEALAKCDPKKGGAAQADALRMRDKVDEAKRKGDHDAVHAAELEFTTMRGDDWNSRQLAELSGEERKQAEDAHRLAVAAALGKIVTEEDPAKKAALDGKTDAEKQAAYTQSAVDFVTRDVVMYDDGRGHHGHYEMKNAKPGDPYTRTIKMEGANRDMAAALLLHGKDSAEARAAKIGIEIERKGDDAKAENIDEAVYDDRFMPLPANASDAEKKQHADEVAKARELRAKTLLLASEKYAGGKAAPKDYKVDGSKSLDPSKYPDGKLPDPHVAEAQQKLIEKLGEKFKDDKVGAQFVTNLIKEERPSAKTASLAMQYAMYSKSGTNEDLMFRYPERMTRDEIAAMKKQFKDDTGKDFDAEAGLYGKGSFAELSGDDALRMERAMLGVARTEQEKAEAAAFAMMQQRRETGSFGQWLAEGSYGEAVLDKTQSGLFASMGVTAEDFTPEGMLKPEAARRCFNDKGEYTGPDRDRFMANVMTGKLAAESYQAVIDQYANLATTGIAILGAIAAAVITVATGGAAGPLIAAAVITGLASMGAQYAIKGGRYGWEQAAIDLGMTAVQAVTAGVGAQLGAAAQIASKGAAAASTASRALTTLAKLFTGNPVVDQIIVGAITGSIGGLAGAAFDEKTWEKGGGDAVGALFGGLIKGALSGAATAALTNSLEALGRNGAAIADKAKAIAAQGGLVRGAIGLAGRGLGAAGKALDKGLNASTGGGVGKSLLAMGQRGLARGVVSGLGGMAGRSTEIIFDKATGKYKGRLDDALSDIGQAGLHAAVQGFGEGAGEAVGQGMHNRKIAATAKTINDELAARGKPPLKGDPMDPQSPIRQATDDLMFMNQHGKNGGDGLGKAINLDHIVTHGGMAHTVATQMPDGVAQDAMRGELLRHVPESLHGDFADVPIRVLSEAEYKALTRSESGPVVTLIENGKPVVVIREGTPLTHLADEGPHLLQTADKATKSKVAKLDEATMARWDELDVDTQVELYKNKIELEIDAHQRVADALDAKLAKGDGDPAQLALDRARNEVTLKNLRARQAEVAAITPDQRAAMQAGDLPKPQYLEQPARLFSKQAKREREFEDLSEEEQIRAIMFEEIVEKGRMAPRGGLVDDDMQNLPDAPKPAMRRGEKMPGRGEVPKSVEAHARKMAREAFGKMLQEALRDPGKHNRLTQASMEHMSEAQLRHVRIHGELPQGVEFHHILTVKDFPEFAHLAEVGLALPTDVHKDAGHGMDTTRPVEAGTLQDHDALTRPQGFHNDPEAQKYNRPTDREVADGTRSKGDVDRDLVIDFEQRVKKAEFLAEKAEANAERWPTPNNIAKRDQARADLAEARRQLLEVDTRIANHAQMQKALMRHVPPELQKQLGDVEIRVLSPKEYAKLTRSENGPVVTLIIDGKPVVVVREGTHPSRVADEGPHLMQAHDEKTSRKVERLDEAELKHWDQMDIDTQIDLYKTKIVLEIDAHQRIKESLQAELASGKGDPKALKQEIERNNATLRNLRERQKEVRRIGPAERAEIASGKQAKPQYLEQPPRLFSKESLTQRFQAEIDATPSLAVRAMEIAKIRDPAQRARAAAEFHAELIALRHMSNRMADAGLDVDGATLARMSSVAEQHRVPAPVLAAHLQDVITNGRLPAGVAPDSAYARALLGLAEQMVGPRRVPTRPVPAQEPEAPRPVLAAEAPLPAAEIPAPVAEAPAPAADAAAATPPAPAPDKRADRLKDALEEVPKLLPKLGIDPELLRDATPEDIRNIYNALDGDPLATISGGKKVEKKKGAAPAGNKKFTADGWTPTDHQEQAARWALAACNGDPAEFARLYEFARARFSALREAHEETLRAAGKPNRTQAMENAAKEFTPKFLSDELRKTAEEIKARPRGQNLDGPTTGKTADEIAAAVQKLERVDFETTAAEAYHAWKHRDEVPSTILPGGSIVARYFAGGMDVIRTGTPVLKVNLDPPQAGTRVVIHKVYVIDGQRIVREVIMFVAPDGTVTVRSWGKIKSIKPSPLAPDLPNG